MGWLKRMIGLVTVSAELLMIRWVNEMVYLIWTLSNSGWHDRVWRAWLRDGVVPLRVCGDHGATTRQVVLLSMQEEIRIEWAWEEITLYYGDPGHQNVTVIFNHRSSITSDRLISLLLILLHASNSYKIKNYLLFLCHQIIWNTEFCMLKNCQA